MTRSLPGAPDLQVKAPNGWAGRLQNVATKVGVKVIPWVPTRVVRLLTGGRSVTIDGNTLDPTLQLVLVSLKLSGEAGLTARDDVAYSRQRIRQTMVTIDRNPLPVGGVADLSIPGPAGDIPTNHTAFSIA